MPDFEIEGDVVFKIGGVAIRLSVPKTADSPVEPATLAARLREQRDRLLEELRRTEEEIKRLEG